MGLFILMPSPFFFFQISVIFRFFKNAVLPLICIIEEGLKQNSKPDLNKNVIQSFLVVPSSSRLTLSGKTKSSNISAKKIFLQLGKKSKSVLVFLTFSKETRFLFSYAKVEALNWQIGNSNEIDRVSKFDNSLSFGAIQNALPQIFFALWFFKDLFTKNENYNFFLF